MQEIQLTHIPKRNENITWKEFGTESILLDLKSGDFFDVNDVGLMIWQQADGQRTVKEIIQTLTASFDASDDEMIADVREFLRELMNNGLITIESKAEALK